MRLLLLLFVLIVSACVAGGPGKSAGGDTAITGGAIAVTTLGDLPGKAASGAPAMPRPRPKPETIAPRANTADAAPTVAQTAEPAPIAAPPPAEPMSAAEKTCVKQGGTWGPAGKAGESCRTLTKDSGKQCDAESDCEGYCLARSGTCAPFRPMFGCNEILQDNGVQVTLCID